MTPKRLYGQIHWEVLKPDVQAKMEGTPPMKFIGAYSRVLTDAWNAAHPDVRAQCTIEAKRLNDGEGSVESKALYVIFFNSQVTVSDPSVLGTGTHASAVSVTQSPHLLKSGLVQLSLWLQLDRT